MSRPADTKLTKIARAKGIAIGGAGWEHAIAVNQVGRRFYNEREIANVSSDAKYPPGSDGTRKEFVPLDWRNASAAQVKAQYRRSAAVDAAPYKTVQASPGAAEMARLREMLAAAERPMMLLGGTTFSAGLAVVLTAIGLIVLYAKHLLPDREKTASSKAFRYLPIASAGVIVCVGIVMTCASLGWIPSA